MASIVTVPHVTTPIGWTAQVPDYSSKVDMPQAFKQFADSIPADLPMNAESGSSYTVDATHLHKTLINSATQQDRWDITSGLEVGFQFTIDPMSASLIIVVQGGTEDVYPTNGIESLAIVTKISDTEWIVSQ